MFAVCIVMANTVRAYIVMACSRHAYVVMACIVMAWIVMVWIVMVCISMACIAVDFSRHACTVMALRSYDLYWYGIYS